MSAAVGSAGGTAAVRPVATRRQFLGACAGAVAACAVEAAFARGLPAIAGAADAATAAALPGGDAPPVHVWDRIDPTDF